MDEPEEGKRTVLTEASTISLGLLLVLLGSIAGGVFYVATAMNKQDNFQARLDKVEAKQEIYNDVVSEMKGDLKEIKGYLKGKGK